MNDTLWWDGIDGEHLVCRPGNETAEGFANACLIVTRIAPSVLLFSGISFFFMAWRQLKLKLTGKIRPGKRNTISITTSERNSRKKKGKDLNNGSHGATLALVLGIVCLFTGLTFTINGHGTIFASDTLSGRIGDACYAVVFCTLWYLALIQLRGAIWFKSLFETSTVNPNPTKRLPSTTEVLDSLQGRFGPMLFLFLVLLLSCLTCLSPF